MKVIKAIDIKCECSNCLESRNKKVLTEVGTVTETSFKNKTF